MSKHGMKAIFFAAAAAVSSVSMAGGLANYPAEVPNAGPGKTRQQVVQELLEFRQNPVVNGWRMFDSDMQWVFVGTEETGKSRAQVERELDAFNKDRAAQARFASMYGAS